MGGYLILISFDGRMDGGREGKEWKEGNFCLSIICYVGCFYFRDVYFVFGSLGTSGSYFQSYLD